MATQYEALPGGDGGAWVAQEQAPRLISPVAAQGTNGQGEAPQRLEVRSATVTLDPPYAAFWARMRLNPRRSTIDMLKSGETRQVTDAIARLILDWRFWDEDGRPIDLTPENVYDLPDDLLAKLVSGYFAAFRDGDDAEQAD
jgi:hypothetical protein